MKAYVIAAYAEEVLSGDIFGTIYDSFPKAEDFLQENKENIPGNPKIFKVTVEEM